MGSMRKTAEPKAEAEEIFLGWTTVATAEEARRLAEGAVASRLAACAQIDGPIRSVYRWEGKIENAEEFRVTFKFPAKQSAALEKWLHVAHPYTVPQWISVAVASVAEPYRQWLLGSCAEGEARRKLVACVAEGRFLESKVP